MSSDEKVTQFVSVAARGNRVNYGVMALEIAKEECGISYAHLCREVGLSSMYITKRNERNATPPPAIVDALARRGKFLSRVNLRRHDFDWICEEFGVKQAAVAREMGISPQALNESKLNGWSEQRRDEVEQTLRSFGRQLLKVTERAQAQIRKAA